MIATVLLILATWFVVGSAATYVWVTCQLRAEQRAADAAFDRELRALIDQST